MVKSVKAKRFKLKKNTNKARNMLEKAINHVIKAESKINAGKRFRRLRVWLVAKKLLPHSYTPNPKCRTKEKKIGYKNNTLCFW